MNDAGLRFYGVGRKRQEVGMRSIRRNCRIAAWDRESARCSRRLVGCVVTAVHLELGADNALFIRGQGGGLSWAQGQPFTQLGNETWIWSVEPSAERLEFQVLLNDEVWERGPAHILEPGTSIQLTPDFEWPEIPRTALPRTL